MMAEGVEAPKCLVVENLQRVRRYIETHAYAVYCSYTFPGT